MALKLRFSAIPEQVSLTREGNLVLHRMTSHFLGHFQSTLDSLSLSLRTADYMNVILCYIEPTSIASVCNRRLMQDSHTRMNVILHYVEANHSTA